MTTTADQDTFDNALVSMTAAMRKLKEENERLHRDADARWKAENRASSLDYQLRELQKKLDEAQKQSEQNYRDKEFWRKAVRYEQKLKNPARRLRHVPIYMSVKRRQYDPPPMVGDWINRERAFLRQWRKENRRPYGSRGVLESILSNDPNGTTADLSQRDATVAATVIQWLGTNCGFSFLHEVEQRIKKQKAARTAKRTG